MKDITNILFKGYKAFSSDEYVKLNDIARVNVIIGKNNSGKTSLLDVVELVYYENAPIRTGFEVDSLFFDMPFDNEMVNNVFTNGLSGIGRWSRATLRDYILGKNFSIKIKGNKSLEIMDNKLQDLGGHINGIVNIISSRRHLYKFRKISAERSINPEVESEIQLECNGDGATNLIRAFINDCNFDETLIESELLKALNDIMMPEAEYENIRVQQVNYQGTSCWEVFLQEKGMQRVPLSKTGSGLKTIVLVLLNLLVIPQVKEYSGCKLVYGFEELENNLHPALQRRLFEYLYAIAIEKDIILYLTTHSHIAINAFFDKEEAKIFHVIKDNGIARIKEIGTHIDKTEILDDLDVKASDLLQSNGIIWVEGPSDRIYIKRWLEIFTENKLEEGKDYQFLYYGGRLLSQYSANKATELINIITTNRNATIVIDSDKRRGNESINNTKKRIVQEFKELNMFSWVTKGKEIENYLPKKALENMLKKTIQKECGQYNLFSDYVEKYYKNFSHKKVPFANQIKAYITSDNSLEILDLKKQVENLYKQMKIWNGDKNENRYN